MALKFIALSGTTSVTENLYIYEHNDQMMVVDCGVGFPDIEMHGVDLVIPDFSYVVENQKRLQGILISQGHEDHIGAIPFLLDELDRKDVPIWMAPLPSEFLKDKLEEFKIKGTNIKVFNPDNDTFDIGVFKINPFRVTHSVPDSVGFAIDTPEGRVFHVPEHKMDQNPVDGMAFDIEKAKRLGSQDILFLASDCLGANKPGYAENERKIEGNLYNIAKDAQRAILFTAISSNIGRFQQAINVAEKLGRKVAFVGRSVQRKAEIAHNLGYMKYSGKTVIPLKKALTMPRNQILLIVAGCYGQVGSSLFRIAIQDHDRITTQPGDMVIFSADPAPPYSKESEDFVIDKLIEQDLDVHYYDLNEGLYVSGHGRQEDILDLFRMTNPKYFIPIGGTVRFMHAYKKLVADFTGDERKVFELKPGESIEFSDGGAKRSKTIPVKEVLVDGHGIGDVGKIMLQDRKKLGESGVAIVIVRLDGKKNKVTGEPEIISRGFVFEKQEKDFLRRSTQVLKNHLNEKGKLDRRSAKFLAIDFLSEFFFRETARRPMILPVIVEI